MIVDKLVIVEMVCCNTNILVKCAAIFSSQNVVRAVAMGF